ncbi:hypothetical protein HX770_02415 [Vibrio parahaemolyticus]|nr:hypothetical protein [Vibrio parahaemolyticus]
MRFYYKFVVVPLIFSFSGCQSTGDSSSSSAELSSEVTTADTSNAVEMTPNIFSEITSQLPEKDKFGEYSKKYGELISQYDGLYYTDAYLSNWNVFDKTYDIPLTIISSSPEKITQYEAVNGLGAKFIVTKVVMYENRILLKNAKLQPIPTNLARELDGAPVRIYYNLINQSRYGDNGPVAPHSICREMRLRTPSSINPFDIWDYGCEISASMIKVESLKTGSALGIKKVKLLDIQTVNYDMESRGLELLSSNLE